MLSKTQFDYYSLYFDFHPENVIIYNFYERPENEFIDFMNKLEDGRTYWFYCAFSAKERTEENYIKHFKDSHPDKDMQEYKLSKSYLLKIRKEY